LFGWQFEDVGIKLGPFRSVNYTLIRHEGLLIGGMIDANLLGRRDAAELSQWVVVMAVNDVEVAAAKVTQQGGIIRHAPVDLDERGRLAIIEDAQGAELALLQTRDGDLSDAPWASVIFSGMKCGVTIPMPELPATWVSYVRVADADAITAQVEALGGQVIIGVTQRDVGGEAALTVAPSGAGIAIQTWTPPTQSARL
jgi:predicted enzyme related to lactoylglutathione lyase